MYKAEVIGRRIDNKPNYATYEINLCRICLSLYSWISNRNISNIIDKLDEIKLYNEQTHYDNQ